MAEGRLVEFWWANDGCCAGLRAEGERLCGVANNIKVHLLVAIDIK
jgi:hypothetical protein